MWHIACIAHVVYSMIFFLLVFFFWLFFFRFCFFSVRPAALSRPQREPERMKNVREWRLVRYLRMRRCDVFRRDIREFVVIIPVAVVNVVRRGCARSVYGFFFFSCRRDSYVFRLISVSFAWMNTNTAANAATFRIYHFEISFVLRSFFVRSRGMWAVRAWICDCTSLKKKFCSLFWTHIHSALPIDVWSWFGEFTNTHTEH